MIVVTNVMQGVLPITWFFLEVGAVMIFMMILSLVVYWITRFGVNIIKNLL